MDSFDSHSNRIRVFCSCAIETQRLISQHHRGRLGIDSALPFMLGMPQRIANAQEAEASQTHLVDRFDKQQRQIRNTEGDEKDECLHGKAREDMSKYSQKTANRQGEQTSASQVDRNPGLAEVHGECLRT